MSERKKYALIAFVLNLTLALAAFVPFIIMGKGVLTLGDDFDAQELVFGMLANREIKEFDVFFNWAIDMGSDFISAFSFYNLGSPFFWITLLFKPEVYPYLIGWILILKYAFAGLFSHLYLERYVSPKYALLGSVLYAFSGFQSMNMIFYHFHDAVVFFPLLLLALDIRVAEKKKGLFAFAVAINALVNWNFFIGEVIFAILYYIVRFDGIGRIRNKAGVEVLKEVLNLLLEGVLGVGISAVLFIPSVYAMMSNSRVQEHISMYDAFVWNPEYLFRNIRALLLPSEAMNFSSLFPDMNWYSIGAYLPLTGISLICVYIFGKKKEKKGWLWIMLIACFIIAAVPVLNSVFVLFYREPYRRWYYMPILLMALASSKVAEEAEEDSKSRKNIAISCVILTLVIIAFGACFKFWRWSDTVHSAIVSDTRFAKALLMGSGGLVITALVCIFVKKKKPFRIALIAGAGVFSIVSSIYIIREYKAFAYYTPEQITNEMLYTAEDIDPDILPYRYAMAEDYYNKNMAYSLPSIDSFISMVDAGIFEFYDSIATHRHVMTFDGPIGTEELLSAKYTIAEKQIAEQRGLDPSKCIEEHDNKNDAVGVYVNDNVPPIGFTYDKYLSNYEFLISVPEDMRSVAMLNYLIVPDTETWRVDGILEHVDNESLELDESMVESACREHLSECSENFEVRRTGFKSVINSSANKYAFYSVPYSKRWSAYVNGNKVEIMNINGLMAVPVSAGENVVEFKYGTFINLASLIISIVSLAATAVLVIGGRKRKSAQA